MATYTVSDIVMVEHISKETSCEMTPAGSEQWEDYHRQNQHLVLVGWAHSHHQVALVPDGTVPSRQDVDTQYTLQSQHGANLMLILNESGQSFWTIPHDRVQFLRSYKGESSTAPVKHSLELVAKATFLHYVREAAEDPCMHLLGKSVRPGRAISEQQEA